MAKIIGNTTTTPMAVPDWNQTDATKADYIKNKPVIPKSLIFDTKESLNNLINEVPGGKNLLNPNDYVDSHFATIESNGSISLGMEGPEGQSAYIKYKMTLENGDYAFSCNLGDNGENCNIFLNDTNIASFGGSGGTHVINVNNTAELRVECYAASPAHSAGIDLQLEKGSTPTEYETFIPFGVHEYGAAKQDLNAGDLLLIQEEKTPDYYWNGSEIVEIEAKGSIDDVTVDLSNYYTKEEINGLIMNGSQIQIITWGADE